MLLSAVSVLVVAKSSSEIPEGLMNNPVYYITINCVKGLNSRHYSSKCQLTITARSVKLPLFSKNSRCNINSWPYNSTSCIPPCKCITKGDRTWGVGWGWAQYNVWNVSHICQDLCSDVLAANEMHFSPTTQLVNTPNHTAGVFLQQPDFIIIIIIIIIIIKSTSPNVLKLQQCPSYAMQWHSAVRWK